MNTEIFEKFYGLDIDHGYVGLEKSSHSGYFCDPIGGRTFAGLGVDGVHFCFIDGFGETVFSVDPMGVDPLVNPLAYNFTDFLRLVLACKNASTVEQIYWMSKEQFTEFLANGGKIPDEDPKMAEISARIDAEAEKVLGIIQAELRLEPMPDPYEYVRDIQSAFDYSKIEFTNEYYECKGLEKPKRKGISGLLKWIRSK